MEHLLTLELPYSRQSGNRHVRHGGGAHYLTEEAVDYWPAVRKAAEKARAHLLDLPGPVEAWWVLAQLEGPGHTAGAGGEVVRGRGRRDSPSSESGQSSKQTGVRQ